MDKFKGSIAQNNVQFPIESVIEPLAGAGYSRAVIYMPSSKISEYLPGVETSAGNVVELNASNYGAIVGGLLRTWLVPFFAVAQANVYIAIYDDTEEATTNTLAIVYEATKMLGYFKLGISDTEDYSNLQVSLSNLCVADPLYSDLWIGTSDTNVLSKSSALITSLVGAGSAARVIYNPKDTINGALAQLGRSLSTANATGTPVGNSVDMVAFNTIQASGPEEDGIHANLTATEKAALDEQKIGYQTYVGDGTENVVTEGSLALNGDSVGANWVKHYVTYMCKVKTANLITRMNKFRNNATYQAALTTLSSIVQKFIAMGRLDNFKITAPVFADLPASGDTIIVPNAWQALYVDNTREVAVYGTLYITKATR